MPPASVPAPILLKARAAPLFSVFSKMSDAKSHRLAKSSPKIAGMNMKMANSSLLSAGSKKGAAAAITVAASRRIPTLAGRAPQIFIALTKSRARGNEAPPILMYTSGSWSSPPLP